MSGTSQFGAYSGHSITVVDLSAHQIAYRTETMGYPQTSGILTTAYEEDSGYVYVYFIDNYTPGKLRVLRDKAGQTKADYVTKEFGMDTPYVLFTPSGDEAQYAICTPVVDSYGVMYFKNDTARMMAFGPSVELEIVQQPTKTQYTAGEAFDPTGMKVELVYASGLRRDVTKYVMVDCSAHGEGRKLCYQLPLCQVPRSGYGQRARDKCIDHNSVRDGQPVHQQRRNKLGGAQHAFLGLRSQERKLAGQRRV